jgi:hypothetical protein
LTRRLRIPDPPTQETFDSAFLSELEGLVTDAGIKVSSVAGGETGARGYLETLAAFLAPGAGRSGAQRQSFLALPEGNPRALHGGDRVGARRSPRREAAQAAGASSSSSGARAHARRRRRAR